jgi:hypothetical protein
MRKLSIFALFLCLFAFPLAAQKKGGRKAGAAIQAYEDKWVAALRVNDLDALDESSRPIWCTRTPPASSKRRPEYIAKLKSGDQSTPTSNTAT